jgi:hypothetical protein
MKSPSSVLRDPKRQAERTRRNFHFTQSFNLFKTQKSSRGEFRNDEETVLIALVQQECQRLVSQPNAIQCKTLCISLSLFNMKMYLRKRTELPWLSKRSNCYTTQWVWRRARGWTVGIRIPVGLQDLSRILRLWGSPSLQTNECRGVELTIHLQQTPKSTIVELYLHFPIHLHGVVLY